MKIELQNEELALLAEAMHNMVKTLGLVEQTKKYFILSDKINKQLVEQENGGPDADSHE